MASGPASLQASSPAHIVKDLRPSPNLGMSATGQKAVKLKVRKCFPVLLQLRTSSDAVSMFVVATTPTALRKAVSGECRAN